MTDGAVLGRLALGPAACAPAFAELFPASGEFAAAVQDLRRLPPADAVDLVAYELLERVRDGLLRGEARWRAPLWPPALASAYGLAASAAGELAGMLPHLEQSRAPDGEPARRAAAAAARDLGLPPLDQARSAAALEREARAGGWLPRFAPPPPPPSEPRRETAAAVLHCGGRILLERRPPDARVTPDVWDLPGGHLEPGEGAEAALARELREELGVRAPRAERVALLVASEPPDGVSYRHHVFLAPAEGAARAREGQSLTWFAPREALALPDINPLAAYVLQELREAGRL